jgi:hypothetical protein
VRNGFAASRRTYFSVMPRTFIETGICVTRSTSSWSRKGVRPSIECAISMRSPRKLSSLFGKTAFSQSHIDWFSGSRGAPSGRSMRFRNTW